MANYFYYQADGGVYGPVSEEKLIEAGRAGKITGDTLAKEADGNQWSSISTLLPGWRDNAPSQSTPQTEATKPNIDINKIAQIVLFAAIGAGAVWYYNEYYTGFTDDEMRRMIASIEENYRARVGFTSVKALMLRRSRSEAFGHVNFTVGGISASHQCIAQMSDRDAQYQWRCSP